MAASLLLAVIDARAADCPEGPVPPSKVAELLDEAEVAFVDLEIPSFIALTDRVRAVVPCLSAAVDPTLVARLHRTEGLRLFGERNVDAVRAFAAARTLEPDYVFRPDTVPSGSPILDDYTAMDLDAGEPVTLPEPLDGFLVIDGLPSRERPQAWPSLVQLVPGEGTAPAWSVYLRHDEPPPPYPAVPVPEPALDPIDGLTMTSGLLGPPPTPVRRGPPPKLTLMVATGTSALVSASLYGAAWVSRGVYLDPETPDTRLPTLRARTNGLTVASAAGGATTLGLGTALAFTW